MSNAKTERLVNLTMALLATQRYMRKSEIFRKVAGYGGSAETKERMFERDKDDLRAMGIQIEVASHDPLFDDEPGYRIKADSYQLPLESFTSEELGIISAALGLWQSSAFEDVAESAARRTRTSTSIDFEFPEIATSANELLEDGLVDITRALGSRSTISFNYKKSSSAESEERKVNPLGLSTWDGGWYLVGEDLSRNDIRVFKLSRMTSQISVANKREMYEIPEDFNVKDYLVMFNQNSISVVAKLRKNQAQVIRAKATAISTLDEEWDRVSYNSESTETALREALWYSDCLVVEQPSDIRDAVIESLTRVVALHE